MVFSAQQDGVVVFSTLLTATLGHTVPYINRRFWRYSLAYRWDCCMMPRPIIERLMLALVFYVLRLKWQQLQWGGLDLLSSNVYMSMKHDRVCCFLLLSPLLDVFGLNLFVCVCAKHFSVPTLPQLCAHWFGRWEKLPCLDFALCTAMSCCIRPHVTYWVFNRLKEAS